MVKELYIIPDCGETDGKTVFIREDAVSCSILDGKRKGRDYHVLELGRHQREYQIPKFNGWKPGIYLMKSDFSRRGFVELDLREKYFGEEGVISMKKFMEMARESRDFIGTPIALEEKRKEIEEMFNKMNESTSEFVVFRTFRKPNPQIENYFIDEGLVLGTGMWDIVEFYVPAENEVSSELK